MNKENFYKILCTYTPEELNEFISSKGKQKMVNAVSYLIKDEGDDKDENKDRNNND